MLQLSNEDSKLRKSVSFDLFTDIIYIQPHNPEQNHQLWWTKNELTCIRDEVYQDIMYIMNHSLTKNISVRGAFDFLFKLNH
jgi:hypothetical protein